MQPRRLNLAKVSAGTQQTLQIVVGNRGQGLLQGKVVVTEGKDWLRFASGAGDQLNLRTERDQPISLQVDTRNLVAGQTYSAKLTVISNGGIAELPVRLELAALPFPACSLPGGQLAA